jgi:hypothetical protein
MEVPQVVVGIVEKINLAGKGTMEATYHKGGLKESTEYDIDNVRPIHFPGRTLLIKKKTICIMK